MRESMEAEEAEKMEEQGHTGNREVWGVRMHGKLPVVGTNPRCRWFEADPETGKRWSDMPGACEDDQKVTFFLFVRGLKDPWKMSRHKRCIDPKGPEASKRNEAFGEDSFETLYNYEASYRER